MSTALIACIAGPLTACARYLPRKHARNALNVTSIEPDNGGPDHMLQRAIAAATSGYSHPRIRRVEHAAARRSSPRSWVSRRWGATTACAPLERTEFCSPEPKQQCATPNLMLSKHRQPTKRAVRVAVRRCPVRLSYRREQRERYPYGPCARPRTANPTMRNIKPTVTQEIVSTRLPSDARARRELARARSVSTSKACS